MPLKSRFFTNAIFIYGAEVSLKASGFLLTVLVARWLGGEELGRWAVAISAMAILGTLLDLGINTYSVRELTVGRMEPSDLATWSLLLRLWGGMGSLALLFLLVFLGAVPMEIFHLLIPLFAAGLLQALGSIYSTFLRARQEFIYESLLKIFQALFQVFVGSYLLWFGFHLDALAWMIVSMGLTALVYYAFLNRRKKFVSFSWPSRLLPNLEALWHCLPFTFLLFFGVIYFRIDMLILRFFWDNRTVGEYAAAYRLLEGILLFPWALSSVLYPHLGKVASRSTDIFRETTELGLKYAFVLGLPVGVLGFYLAQPLIFLIYGDLYKGSVPVFQVLAFTASVIFLSAVTSTVIQIGSKPAVNTWIAAVMVAENIALNLWWVPQWAVLGASWATLVTELSGLILGIIYIRRKLFPLPIISPGLRTLAAALCTWLMVTFLPNIWMIPFYIMLYVGAIWVFGVVQPKDRRILGEAV